MTILALDSSSRTASTALYREGVLLGQSYQNNGLTHSQTLMPMVESLLRNTCVEHSEIGLIAVTHGPGSFTGLRIGVSTAAGLAWGWGLSCCGVSSLMAAAMGVCHMGGLICAVMDARRDQVYNALFFANGGVLTRLTEDRALSLTELWADIQNKEPVLVGDGAELCYNQRIDISCQMSENVRLAPPHLRYPCAWAVAELAEKAYRRGEVYPCDKLKPVYLRPSQAEREKK